MKSMLTLSAFFAFALTSLGQSWELLTPMQTDDIVRNCSFLDEQNGYSVIQTAGTVLKTTDGGNSWSRPWTPGMSANLYDVEMVSIDTVFTAGISGEIFRSIDEGESFQELTTPTNEVLYALEFIDSQLGFAAGFNGVILKTTNGGNTWELKDTQTTSRLYDIEFVNESTGFACGWNGTVLKTTDVGETWQALTTGYSGALFNCTFPSLDVGYACGFSQTILKTSDGGASWQVQNSGSNTLNYIEFKDDLNGWAGGDFGAFFTTTNGGQTWTSSTPFGGDAIWSGQYVSESAAYLMGRGLMVKSENGAADWELLKNGVPNATYNGLFFFSDDVGYAAGAVGAFAEGTNRSGIVFTTNGGQTWDIQATGFSGGWQDIHFSDSNNGTVIGGGSFGKTTNGGESWSFSSIPFDLTGRCSWFFNANEGVIGGQGVFSSVCKTVDGGQSYGCQDNTLAADFYFIDDLNGWAVAEGSSENVLHTVDGGETWMYVPTGNFQTKHSVFFLDENHGWIGAANGTVLRTVDGGATWSSSNSGSKVIGIRFYSEEVGFCADEQGYVWRSQDGGATWELLISGDDPTFAPFKEAFFTENNVYIGGWSGDIYKATLGCTDIAPAQIFAQNQWCFGEQNTIGFSSVTPVVSFDWVFPEGWAADVNFSSVNLTAGETGGEIQLTTTNVCGLTATTQIAVQVIPEVGEIAIMNDALEFCSNLAFSIDLADAQSGIEYAWSFPSEWDASVTETSLVVTNAEVSGVVTITAQNACGSAPPFQETVTILPAPEVTFVLPETVCDNATLSLAALPVGGVFTGAGVSEGVFDPSGLEVGSVEITYTVTSDNTCSSAATQTLMVNPSEVVGGEWSVFDVPICGGTLQFQLTGVENFDDWVVQVPGEWGELVIGATEDPSGSIDNVTLDGELVITVSNACGTEAVFTNAVELLTVPETPELLVVTESWCEGASGEASFEVFLPDSLIVVASSLDFQITQSESLATVVLSGEPGANFITFALENECGTSENLNVDVTIHELPELVFSLESDTLCTGNAYPFTVEPSGGLIEGEGVSDGLWQAFFLEADQSYDFTYTYTDEFGCTNTDSLSVYLDACLAVLANERETVRVYPIPTSGFLIVETHSSRPMQYSIFDMAGKEVVFGTLGAAINHLSLDELTPGSYVLRFGSSSKKFVVE